MKNDRVYLFVIYILLYVVFFFFFQKKNIESHKIFSKLVCMKTMRF